MILTMKRFTLFSILILFSGLLFLSCENTVEEENLQQPDIADPGVNYGNKSFVFPDLSEEAKEAVAKWSPFEDFETEVRSINNQTIVDLRNKTERLQSHTDSLTKKIPNELFTNPIYTRLIVVHSRVKLLHQAVRKDRADSTQIQNYMSELNSATRNLLLQINEKFQKEAIDEQRKEDEQKELEKQQRFLDSVYRAELRDKNNGTV
jgi:hypothetical protein